MRCHNDLLTEMNMNIRTNEHSIHPAEISHWNFSINMEQAKPILRGIINLMWPKAVMFVRWLSTFFCVIKLFFWAELNRWENLFIWTLRNFPRIKISSFIIWSVCPISHSAICTHPWQNSIQFHKISNYWILVCILLVVIAFVRCLTIL